MKIMRVGDPHIRPTNIAEAEKLMQFVLDKVVATKVDRLEILGDLFHTHAVVRLEVLQFWDKWLQLLAEVVETVVLVGNHDQTGDYHKGTHALSVFKRITNPNLKIIEKPTAMGPFLYLPYIHDEESFIQAIVENKTAQTNMLVCHAEFGGSQYDNGFYSPHGFNPDTVPVTAIISGHIHKEQIIANGKVDYPGTPKWDSASDANEKKGIWLYEHADNGLVVNRYLIPTDSVVTPIVSISWAEGEEMPAIPANSRVSIELVGSSAWVTKSKVSLKGKVSIKVKITDKRRSFTRTPGTSFMDFLTNRFETPIPKQSLVDYIKELGIV